MRVKKPEAKRKRMQSKKHGNLSFGKIWRYNSSNGKVFIYFQGINFRRIFFTIYLNKKLFFGAMRNFPGKQIGWEKEIQFYGISGNSFSFPHHSHSAQLQKTRKLFSCFNFCCFIARYNYRFNSFSIKLTTFRNCASGEGKKIEDLTTLHTK